MASFRKRKVAALNQYYHDYMCHFSFLQMCFSKDRKIGLQANVFHPINKIKQMVCPVKDPLDKGLFAVVKLISARLEDVL